MSFSFEWIVTPEVAFGQLLGVYSNRIRSGVRRIAHRRAVEIEEWMKENHPWQNVTGAAEEGLEAYVEEIGLDMVQIILQHGVDYGVYLELSRGGSWGVIAPALDFWGPVVWADVQALVSATR